MRPGYIDNKEAIRKRLRRVEGQVRGVQRMVDEDRYCIEILEQVSAATRALQAVALELLDDHLAHCVSDAVRKGGDEADTEARRGLRRHRAAGAFLIAVLATATVVVDVGRSLREGFFMFWETLWPLVLGFGISGAVQAFVSRDAMQQKLGDHRPRAVLRGHRATAWSPRRAPTRRRPWPSRSSSRARTTSPPWCSCSRRPTSCIELGIVLVVLMGWQFAVSEFVGGFIMIALLASLGALWLRGRRVVEARERLSGGGDAQHR